MSRSSLHALSWLALSAALLSCSSENQGDVSQTTPSGTYTCIIVGSQLDCTATAEVRVAQTNAVVSNADEFPVDVGSIPINEYRDYKFVISNAGTALAAAELQISTLALEYNMSSPEESPELRAFECYEAGSLEGENPAPVKCSDMKGKWKKMVPAAHVNESAGRVSSQSFTVRYTRLDSVDRSATIRIKMLGDRELLTDFRIRFKTKQGAPKASASPTDVQWPYVEASAPDDKKWSSFKLFNTGDADLIIGRVEFEGGTAFELEVPNADDSAKVIVKPGEDISFDPAAEEPKFLSPFVIAAGGNREFRVKFTPIDDIAKQGVIRIIVNDPSAPKLDPADANSDRYIAVNLIANAKVPCVKLEPFPKMNFGGVLFGISDSREFVVKSCGSEDLKIYSIKLTGKGTSDEYSLDFTETTKEFADLAGSGPTVQKPLILTQQGDAIVTVRYDPKDITPVDADGNPTPPDTDMVEVTSNAFATKTLTVEGYGVKTTCPKAKVSVLEGEEVVPQTILHLKGEQSVAPGGGTIKKYQWTAKQPAGSGKAFGPNSSYVNPTFTPDAAGEYEFCLDVWDQNNTKSCTPACVTVLVVPNNAIHVELLWDTPADADQTDAGVNAGADMDLHFAHPLGSGPDLDCDGTPDPWFSNPFDTFWFNPNPNWGAALAGANDDPSLDLDDTDGAGPENLNLENPEGDAGNPIAYSVGIHYWHDHGYGTSLASVRIYLQGVLALNIDKVEMDPLDMWYVAKIHWPNQLTGVDQPPFTVCKQSGDACIGQQDATNPKGGKMWKPAGDWCITKCYENKSFTASTTTTSAKCGK
jgi:hypothetical protein